MRYLTMLFLTISLLSCGKEDIKICDELNCDLIGEWNWTRTYGSIAGQTWTPENTAVTKRLEANQSHLNFFENDSLVQNVEYLVFESDTILGDSVLRTFITYGNETRLFVLEEMNLELSDLCADCYSDYYERIE